METALAGSDSFRSPLAIGMMEKDNRNHGNNSKPCEKQEGPLIISCKVDQPACQYRGKNTGQGEAARCDSLSRSRFLLSYVDIRTEECGLGQHSKPKAKTQENNRWD